MTSQALENNQANKVRAGKRLYTVLRREPTESKYPNMHRRGFVSIVTATFGQTIFQIYERTDGPAVVLRAFV